MRDFPSGELVRPLELFINGMGWVPASGSQISYGMMYDSKKFGPVNRWRLRRAIRAWTQNNRPALMSELRK